MRINLDLTKRAVVDSHRLSWVDSTLPGVQRRMLERVGGEIARATSIVRYAPGSFFEEHVHDGGEEILVLDGVFSDETGDFPTGMYVRNPIGSRHAPYSREGCTILVKLQQFERDDREFVKKNTNIVDWLPLDPGGLSMMPLHKYCNEQVALMKWDPGTFCELQGNPGGTEIYVLSGTLVDEHGIYPAGTWIRNPRGFEHAPWSNSGCVVYIKTGHL